MSGKGLVSFRTIVKGILVCIAFASNAEIATAPLQQTGTESVDSSAFSALYKPTNLSEKMTTKVNDSFVAGDYDGDGIADLVLRDRTSTLYEIRLSSTDEIKQTGFGFDHNDIIINGDFDGDGIADFAVRNPKNSSWLVKNSSGSNYASALGDGIQRFRFGLQESDIPVASDYDGDGITDIAIRRPSNATWYVRRSSDSKIVRIRFGLQSSDIPVPADYDGDGKADIAVRRVSNSTWYILNSSGSNYLSDSNDGIQRRVFGKQVSDIAVPADYDGDGIADIAIRRPSNRTWYIKCSSDDKTSALRFGLRPTDVPVVSDYDGDGKADIAIRRAATNFWYIKNSSNSNYKSSKMDGIQRIEFGTNANWHTLLEPLSLDRQIISDSIGPQRTLFALVGFADTAKNITLDDVKKLVMDNPDSLDNFLRANSNDKAWIVPQYLDWINLDKPSTDYFTASSRDTNGFLNDAVDKIGSIVNFDEVDRLVLMGTRANSGTPGCFAYRNKVVFGSGDSQFAGYFAVLGGGGNSEGDVGCIFPGRIAHEYGHTFDFGHIFETACPVGVLPMLWQDRFYDNGCNNNGYFFTFDTMSGDDQNPLFSSVWRSDAGWFEDEQTALIEASGIFDLQ